MPFPTDHKIAEGLAALNLLLHAGNPLCKQAIAMMKRYLYTALFLTLWTAHTSAWGEQPPSRHALFIYLFIHDEIEQGKVDAIKHEYFAWLVKDLESFTGRRIQIQVIRKEPQLTDIAYKSNTPETTLLRWTQQLGKYRDAHNLRTGGTNKYMLLTANKLSASVLGISHAPGHAAIASLESFTAPAHELGHLLGAKHEAAQVNYNGWWCQTNMADRNRMLGNCYVYSGENKRLISRFLERYP
jgi:hypothetical protein